MDAQGEVEQEDDEEEGEVGVEDEEEDDNERAEHGSARSADRLSWLQDSGAWRQPQSADGAAFLPSPSSVSSIRPRPRYSGSLTRSRIRLLVSAMVVSTLQPLRYCLPAIVQQFSRVARDMDILDLRPVLRSMRRAVASNSPSAPVSGALAGSRPPAASTVHISHSSLNNGSGLLGYTAASQLAVNNDASTPSSQLMHAYFPFDPFFLSNSATLIAPLYTFAPPAATSADSQRIHIAGKRKSQVAAEAATAHIVDVQQRAVAQNSAEGEEETGDESAESGSGSGRRRRRRRADKAWSKRDPVAHSTSTVRPPQQQRHEAAQQGRGGLQR